MAYLTQEQIDELPDTPLSERSVFMTRGESRHKYTLLSAHSKGMKGVVWRANDDLGNEVALKIIPCAEYISHSLIDEMTEASKLDPDYFARVWFFGDFNIKEKEFSTNYKAIAIEWINGQPLNEFVEKLPLTGTQFLSIANQL